MPSFVEIGPVILEEKMKIWKVYSQTDGQTMDNRRSEAHLSFQLRWATDNKWCFFVKDQYFSVTYMYVVSY